MHCLRRRVLGLGSRQIRKWCASRELLLHNRTRGLRRPGDSLWLPGHHFFRSIMIAFPTMRLDVSPTPIGRMPGFVFRGISRLAKNGSKIFESTGCVASLLEKIARASHSDAETSLYEIHRCRQCSASPPEGPTLPCVRRAACLIKSPVRPPKMIGFTGWSGPCKRLS